MSEIVRKFSEVVSESQIERLYRICDYDIDDNETFFSTNDFINDYSLIEYGDIDSEWGTHHTDIINTKGEFVEIKLKKDIEYANGKIIKLNKSDNGSYSFEIHRILQLDYKYECFKGYVVESQSETSFFFFKVTRYSNKRDEDTLDIYFVINSSLKVIASFTDTNTWGNEYDGYKNCNVYTDRDYFFINDERKYLVFSQKLMANCDDNGFYNEHMYGLDSASYDDYMQEYEPGYDWNIDDNTVYEYSLDEETLGKAIAKSEGELDEEDEDYDDIPYIDDITFFFDDKKNKLYKDAFTSYYRTLYGIIDCNIKSSSQLLPFTDNIDYAISIIWDRWRCEKEISENRYYRFYGQGWDIDNKCFYGYVMREKFFNYPSKVKGYTLKYVYKYYPDTLKWLVEHQIIVIPNKLLDSLGNNELTRYIRIEQEKHLEYAHISSIDDTLSSNELYGIVSTYQGKTLRQIVYSKGGTKHLVNLLKFSNLNIEKDVVEELIDNTENELESKCYNILLSVIEDIEYREEEYNNWVQQQWEEQMNKDIQREFDDMMDDFDAWGNID